MKPEVAMALDLAADGAALTAALVDIESVSGAEKPLADAIEAALRPLAHLTVYRDGQAVVARTTLGRPERVILAGHIDTVPIAGNLPSRREQGRLFGCGTCDMKSGVAIQLRLAAALASPVRDVSYVFYDCEEVEAERNGLGRLARDQPELLAGDFAVLLEPTGAAIEGGCQGTLRAEVVATGERAHSARAWMGRNAIHEAGDILRVLRDYQPRHPEVDGLTYREGLNAVGISGGIAGNVIPDRCGVTVNYRFAPDLSPAQAEEHVRQVFAGWPVTVVDVAPGARPGLDQPAAASFAAAVGGQPRAKLGWTDVARFASFGIPAVNYGPGDPQVAHSRGEYVEVRQITDCEERMRAWLTS
ncbi:MAG TPA: succinyl-diaminopimelate desuccinylase [Streptosporangiaceae bacterium]|nr:succinyl-diaminopimelate desuccinylase [Streptosporangiaceae bacterium]